MAAIRWSVDAQSDLRSIFDYIARDSVGYAVATVTQILTSIDRLAQHPKLGRIVPEYSNPIIRELIVMNYRVVYRLKESVPEIAAIIQGSRDLVARLGEKL